MIITGEHHGIRLYEKEVHPIIYVGIDITRLNHFTSVLSSDGEMLIEPFKSTNDYDSFYLLLSRLDSLNQDSNIDLKSTAHYSDNLVHFLLTRSKITCVL